MCIESRAADDTYTETVRLASSVSTFPMANKSGSVSIPFSGLVAGNEYKLNYKLTLTSKKISGVDCKCSVVLSSIAQKSSSDSSGFSIKLSAGANSVNFISNGCSSGNFFFLGTGSIYDSPKSFTYDVTASITIQSVELVSDNSGGGGSGDDSGGGGSDDDWKSLPDVTYHVLGSGDYQFDNPYYNILNVSSYGSGSVQIPDLNVGSTYTVQWKYDSVSVSDVASGGASLNFSGFNHRFSCGTYTYEYPAGTSTNQATFTATSSTLSFFDSFNIMISGDFSGSGTWSSDWGVTISDIQYKRVMDQDTLDDIENNTDRTAEATEQTAEATKGIWQTIQNFFGSFFQNLIDSVIGLFVPSSEEMSGLFDELNQFFSDTFGFLYAPFDYLIRLVGCFTSSTGSTGLTFPGFSIMGQEVWAEQTYDIAGDPVAGKVLEYVRIGTGVLLAGWFIMYLQDFFKERFGKG